MNFNPYFDVKGENWSNDERTKIGKFMSDIGIVGKAYPIVVLTKSPESQPFPFRLKIGRLYIEQESLDALLSELGSVIRTIEDATNEDGPNEE